MSDSNSISTSDSGWSLNDDDLEQLKDIGDFEDILEELKLTEENEVVNRSLEDDDMSNFLEIAMDLLFAPSNKDAGSSICSESVSSCKACS